MRSFKSTALISLVALCLGACAQGSGSGVVPTDDIDVLATKLLRENVAANHPVLDAQDQLIACADCHMDVTPAIYESWYASSHGIGSVKCYQCHGTYEDMKLAPSMSNCATCHAGMLTKATEQTPCWSCHPAHEFNPHAVASAN